MVKRKSAFPQLNQNSINKEVNELFKILFPLCRSLTGKGTLLTLQELKKISSFNLHKIRSGTKCFDWKIPDEWNINDAYIKDGSHKKVIDYKSNNINIVNYSTPINKIITFDELNKHLHTSPDHPTLTPYRTSYYKKNWGFCMPLNKYNRLNKKGKYHVYINSTLKPGNLYYGEKIIKGKSKKEILISTYDCHPSLANDNLSGIILWTLLLRELKKQKTYYTYRFVIAPETIGAIAYLSKHKDLAKKTVGGLVITCVAGPGKIGYKKTFQGNSLVDQIVETMFLENKIDYKVYPFDINGSDERQYSSPAFRIPVGTICKDKYYEYDYYHTSGDNLNYVKAKYLTKTLDTYLKAIQYLEMNRIYKTTVSHGEPMLGKRGLYASIGGVPHQKFNQTNNKWSGLVKSNFEDTTRWLIFYSDGMHSLLDICRLTRIPLTTLYDTAKILGKLKLLKTVN